MKNLHEVSVKQPITNEYLPTNFKITVWSKLKPYFNELLARPLKNAEDIEKWLNDKKELERTVKNEREARKLGDLALAEYFEFQIQPKIEFFINELNQRQTSLALVK